MIQGKRGERRPWDTVTRQAIVAEISAGASAADTARRHGVSLSTIAKWPEYQQIPREARVARPGPQSTPDNATGKPSESFAMNGNTAEVSRLVNDDVRTLADLISVCQIDTDEWEVERWVANKWAMGYATTGPGGERAAAIRPLFQVKAWLRRRVAIADARDEIESLKADAKAAIAHRPAAVPPSLDAEHVLEVMIPDLHIGKLAWGAETGHGPYDSAIAVDRYEAALEALLARTSQFRFCRVVFPVGNDLMHTDSRLPATTKGTILDTDTRYQKAFIAARRLITRAIERLRQIAHVTVVMVPGNHDNLSVWHLGDSLECLYANVADVEVMNSPNPRKYVSFGRNMLLLTHGSDAKLDRLPAIMSSERADMWGRTTHREAHVGHFHSLRVQEHGGARVRVSPALCSADAWHSAKGFVGAHMAAEAFVWHLHDGIVCQASYTVTPHDPEREEAGRLVAFPGVELGGLPDLRAA